MIVVENTVRFCKQKRAAKTQSLRLSYKEAIVKKSEIFHFLNYAFAWLKIYCRFLFLKPFDRILYDSKYINMPLNSSLEIYKYF